MRLRAQILIDIDAEDFSEAAMHQDKVEQIYRGVREQYDQAQLEFRQRRVRSHRVGVPGNGLQHFTGRMAEYED